MSNFLQWLTMGGYSIYIWPAYGMVCVYLVMNLLGLKLRQQKTERKIFYWFKR